MNKSNNKIICIIQARMNSTRFPGKVLKKIDDKPLLWYLLNSLQYSKTLDHIVVATTKKKIDDQIVKLCNKMEISTFRGNENNVLNRFCETGKKYNATHIVRISADCPFMDPIIVDKVVRKSLSSNIDYVSNTLPKTYPMGYEVEVIKFPALLKSEKMTNDIGDREHVTLFIMRNPKIFSQYNVEAPNLFNKPKIRVCVDTEEDFCVIQKIVNLINNKQKFISIRQVIGILEKNPKIKKLNSHVKPIITHGFV
jgi:spore coat polysaccharide biosynthesis protein SpsF